MPYWWEASPVERYWCEITDRDDLGGDLKCPQTSETGKEYWSYSLINLIEPGDIVFHYSTRSKAYVGASVAGTPVEERPIVWAPHGTVGRGKPEARSARPGWWLPLYGFTVAEQPPLSLAELNAPDERAWLAKWLTQMQDHGTTAAAPLLVYRPDELRAMQGYLTKMPSDWVHRWPKLSALESALSGVRQRLEALGERVAPLPPKGSPVITWKRSDDYVAVLKGGTQRRTRAHEALVRSAGEAFQAAGASIATPHPLDLLITSPLEIIVEAKSVGERPCGFAIREAIGQLHEYRHFIGPRAANLCILLDDQPTDAFVGYVEKELRMMLLWKVGNSLTAGPSTFERLASAGINLDAARIGTTRHVT
jgi:hypothetical protein